MKFETYEQCDKNCHSLLRYRSKISVTRKIVLLKKVVVQYLILVKMVAYVSQSSQATTKNLVFDASVVLVTKETFVNIQSSHVEDTSMAARWQEITKWLMIT